MNRKGFILIEMVAASLLFSIAGTGLYGAFANAMKINRTIRETSAVYSPLKILWMRAGRDLRNTAVLRDYPFLGKQQEMKFAILSEPDQLVAVRYFVKRGKLIRAETKLPEKFVKERGRETLLMEDIEKIKFEYAYLDEEENLFFKPVWMEEPYFGIPKAVRIEVKRRGSGKEFMRLFSLPQGQWGHVAISEGATK